MESYEPVRFGTHVFEVTLQSGEAKATLTVSMGGNCYGFDVFDPAVNSLLDSLPDAAWCGGDDDFGDEPVKVLTLKEPDGSDYEIEGEKDDDGDWLKKLVVGVRIVSWTPDGPKPVWGAV